MSRERGRRGWLRAPPAASEGTAMRLTIQYLGAFALAALVVAAAALALAGLGSCGLDPASLRELADRVERERARREVLLEQTRSSLARVFARARLNRDLAE